MLKVLVGSAVVVGLPVVVLVPFGAGCSAAIPGGEFRIVDAPIHVGDMPSSPVLADLDGNGTLDAVVACGPCCGASPTPDSGHVQVLLNDGAGHLTPAGPPMKVGETALGADVGDVNEDGIPDIVVQHHSSYDVAILIGHGDGRFSSPQYVPLHSGESPHVHSIRLADVDQDGHLDLLATLVDDHALAVLLGDGTGGFQPALGQPYFAHRHPYGQLNVEDVNLDGVPDAIMTDMRGNGMTVLVGSGTGMFAPLLGFNLNTTMPIVAAERPMACDLGDLDGDGDLDAVAFIDESPFAVVMINAGKGRYEPAADPKVDLAVASVGGRLRDINGDGHLDLLASGTQTKEFSISMGVGDGTFHDAHGVHASGVSPKVSIGDMDGDGRLDVVTGNYGSGTVSVLLWRAP